MRGSFHFARRAAAASTDEGSRIDPGGNGDTMKTLRLALACAAVLAVGACDDEPPPPGGLTDWTVNVRDAETGAPVAGVKVVPMDRATNAPLAVPLASGADGVCDFGELHAWPAVLAFAPEGYRIFGAPLQEWVAPVPAADAASPSALTPPAPEAPPWLVRVVASPPPAGFPHLRHRGGRGHGGPPGRGLRQFLALPDRL